MNEAYEDTDWRSLHAVVGQLLDGVTITKQDRQSTSVNER